MTSQYKFSPQVLTSLATRFRVNKELRRHHIKGLCSIGFTFAMMQRYMELNSADYEYYRTIKEQGPKGIDFGSKREPYYEEKELIQGYVPPGIEELSEDELLIYTKSLGLCEK
jgi:hypothetical protein